MTHEHTPPETGCTPEEQSAWHAGIDAGRDIERGNAAAQEPVAWVAADTLNSPHPTCISSLAYMSQIDRERGREYVPLAIIDRYAAPVAAQKADDADPLQGAADWLVKALAKPRPTEIAARLLIGYNRAERLFDAAIAQQGNGGTS